MRININIPINVDTSIIFSGLAYLLMFRLAVLFLGGLCVVLGYRLFTQPYRVRQKQAVDLWPNNQILQWRLAAYQVALTQ